MTTFEQARSLMNVFKRAKHTTPTSKTLVIIDMQPDFIGEYNQDLILTICTLIRHAKQNEWPIILVEFSGYGYTVEPIREAISDYPCCETILKSNQDGGQEILDCIHSHPAWPLDLLVCGIFGDECVAETVCGLFNNSDIIEVDVITDAVYPNYCSMSEPDEYGQQRERELTLHQTIGAKMGNLV